MNLHATIQQRLQGRICCLLSQDAEYGRRNQSVAFTLLEVLIAVAIFSIVLVAINTVFFAALRLRARASQAVEDLTPVGHAVAIMKRDLLAATPPGRLLSSGMTTTPTTMATGMGSGPAGGILEFSTGTGIIDDDAPWGDALKVDYYLRQPLERTTATGRDLIRAVSHNLLTTTQEQPEEQLILEDVEQLQFSFYDGSQWRQTWDGSNTVATAGTNVSSMPSAVEVTIQLAPAEGKVRGPIEFIVPIRTQVVSSTSTQTNTP